MLADTHVLRSDSDVAAWAAPFLLDLLHQWLNAAQTERGIYHPFLDRQWRRVIAEPRTLVSQSRLIYNFCIGYEVSRSAAYADAALQGLEALGPSFAKDDGGYLWSVNEDGEELDAIPDAYGHAFCILALATAARALDDSRWLDAALSAWRYVYATFTDRQGGLVWYRNGPGCWDAPRSQNPLMHLFEALMALSRVDRSGESIGAARKTLTFVQGLTDFKAGTLREWHSPRWLPASVAENGHVDLGHAFEWAFLCSEWAALTGDTAILATGHAFLQTGVSQGLDGDGGVMARCSPEGALLSRHKGLWQQCEGIRALHRYASEHGRADLHPSLLRALNFYMDKFVDTEFGGVFARADHDAATDEFSKGDPWKLDYHSVGMLLELTGLGRES